MTYTALAPAAAADAVPPRRARALYTLAVYAALVVALAVAAGAILAGRPLTSADVQAEAVYAEHGCTTAWADYAGEPAGALAADGRRVSHVSFAEGWAALVDLDDDGRQLVAVCDR